MSLADLHNLDHTVLICADLAAQRAFYRDVLRFPVEVDHTTWVTFRVGGTRLSLKARGRSLVGEDGPAIPGSAQVQLAFRVPLASLAGCEHELRTAGVPIAAGPLDIAAWRHRALFFRDAENNIIEIYADV